MSVDLAAKHVKGPLMEGVFLHEHSQVRVELGLFICELEGVHAFFRRRMAVGSLGGGFIVSLALTLLLLFFILNLLLDGGGLGVRVLI